MTNEEVHELAMALANQDLDLLGGAISAGSEATKAMLINQVSERVGIRNLNMSMLTVTVKNANPSQIAVLRRLQREVESKLTPNAGLTGQIGEMVGDVKDKFRATIGEVKDTWLAKNIRPLTLGLMALAYAVFTIYFVVNMAQIAEKNPVTMLGVFGVFSSLIAFVIWTYFSSRKEEKLETIRRYYEHIKGEVSEKIDQIF